MSMSRKRTKGSGTRIQLQPVLQRGITHHNKGQFREAEHCYQIVLRENPNHPEALNLLGNLAQEANRVDLSIDMFEKSVAIKPKDPAYRVNLANSLLLADQSDLALKHVRKALSLKPGLPEALSTAARAYRACGKGEDAEKMYKRLLAMDPNNVNAKVGLADTLVEQGQTEQAVAMYRDVLNKAPGTLGAVTGLTRARRFQSEDPEFQAFEALISSPAVATKDRTAVHFALGKMYDDVQQFDRAFEHYQSAKAGTAAKFDLRRYRSFVDRSIELFTPLFFLPRRKFGEPSDRPVFIVGMPRSGTTLTEQILSSHPDVTGAGELPDIEHATVNLAGGANRFSEAYFDNLRDCTPERVKRTAQRYLRTLKRRSTTSKRVVDKMPHNFEALGVIALMFPNARIVHCRRDPMDTCVSCFTQHFRETHGYTAALASLGHYYREYERLMDHWREHLPIKFLDVYYETVVNDLEGQARRLVEFAELPWDDACVRFHENKRLVRTPSRWQVRQPVYRTSLERWKRYDKHLGPLKEALGDLFVGG